MSTNLVKQATLILGGCILFMMTSVAQSANNRFKITEVLEEPVGFLIIMVNGLRPNHQLEVMLGNYGPLVVGAVTPTSIEAALPIDIVPGDYLLTVISINRFGKRKGIAGYDLTIGAIGPAGPRGEQGPAGPQGEQGIAGSQGESGPVGPQGEQGPAGPQGATGPAGPQGPVGSVGPQGPTGLAGPQGATGPAGPQGAPGNSGLAGQVCQAGFAIGGFDANGNILCRQLPQ